ncbi:hypothetical protein EJ02DRAFT_140499 [Clathrospora elynae]|uniref:Myb-like domain-containing protein n=1 Tax=Clathrospora elynae TaxID=706981 RepID=A0A6A5T6N2_9PLEO|nr:hypothetical protein EJ02DRAFT_140499 [Clathrospora elynae]
MTQAVLQQQRGVDEHNLLRQSFPHPHSELQYNPQALNNLHQFGDVQQGYEMAHSILQRPYRSDSYMQAQAWPFQEGQQHGLRSSVTAPANPSSNVHAYSPNRSWGAASAHNNISYELNHEMMLEPCIMPESDDQFRRNAELLYNTMAAQNTVVKARGQYGDVRSWVPSVVNGLSREVSVNGSDLDTIDSHSPKSSMSDDFDHSYSPGPMSEQASPGGNWHGGGYSAPFQALKEPSPVSASSMSPFGSAPVHKSSNTTDIDMSGLPLLGSNMTMSFVPPAEFGGYANVPIASFQNTDSEYSHSQESSPNASPWFLPNYSHDLTGLPYRTRTALGHNAQSDSDTSVSSANDSRCTQYRSAPWTETRAVLPAQDRLQARFQVPRSSDAQAQRQHNDDLLVQGKKEGLTYKDIRLKMVGEKPAESTLRGRYRSLTKARKDRVRKPVWTKVDIDLLNETVQQEFDRIDSSLQNPHTLTFDQRLVKIPWKRVADYINENGGSYHFGNSTCKRKWLELNADRK